MMSYTKDINGTSLYFYCIYYDALEDGTLAFSTRLIHTTTNQSFFFHWSKKKQNTYMPSANLLGKIIAKLVVSTKEGNFPQMWQALS